MKREIEVALYFWATIIAAEIFGLGGETIACSVLLAAAIVIAVLNLIAREYFATLKESQNDQT